MSRHQSGSYIVRGLVSFWKMDIFGKFVMMILVPVFSLVDIFPICLIYQWRGHLKWPDILVSIGIFLFQTFLSFLVNYILCDILLNESPPPKKIIYFHLKYVLLPLLVVYIVHPFTEKVIYVDKKMDVKMEMTYNISEKDKKW